MITPENLELAKEYNINIEVFNNNESIEFKANCLKNHIYKEKELDSKGFKIK